MLRYKHLRHKGIKGLDVRQKEAEGVILSIGHDSSVLWVHINSTGREIFYSSGS